MKNFIFLMLVFGIYSCEQSSSAPLPVDLTGFIEESVPGTSATKVVKKENGNILESGYLMNGSRVGEWTTYDNEGKIKTTTSYIEGKKNGRYLEYSNRGQIELLATYQDDKYHGPYGKLKFGRYTEEMNYKNGELDGEMKTYFKTGKIQKLVTFKDGVQHGELKYYDEDGNVTLEYQYENGKKVGGGMIEK